MHARFFTLLFIALLLASTLPVTDAKSPMDFSKLSDPATLPSLGINDVSWSPDSNYVALGSGSASQQPLFVYYRSDATSSATLTKLADPTLGSNAVADIQWSPDGTYLTVTDATAASTPGARWYTHSGSGASTMLTKCADPSSLMTGPIRHVEWSHSGNFVAFAGDASPYLTVYAVTGSCTFTKLANPATLPATGGSALGWSYNDAYVAFGDASGSTSALTVYSVTGSGGSATLTALTRPTLAAGGLGGIKGQSLKWMNNRLALAVGGFGDGTHQALQIWLVTGSTLSADTVPTEIDETYQFSFNSGDQFVFGARNTPFMRVWTLSSTTWTQLSNPATLPTDQGRETWWSPEGSTIAVCDLSAPLVMAYDLSGSMLTKLSDPTFEPSSPFQCNAGNGAHAVEWSPDGKDVAFVSTTATGLHLLVYSTQLGATTPFSFSTSLTLTPISSTELVARWAQESGATNYSAYLSRTSGFTPSATTLHGSTNDFNFAFSSLSPNTQYCAKIQSYAAGALVNTSSEACATTTPSGLTFSGNFTRVIPDNVTIIINRASTNNFFVDCVRIDPTGAVGNVCTVDKWKDSASNTYSFLYHQSLPVNTTTGDNATYLLYVTNATGAYLGGVTFCLQIAWQAACNFTVGADLQVQLGNAAITEYAGILKTNQEAVTQDQETTATNYFLGFLVWLFRTDLYIPNISWLYILAIIIAGYGVATNARRSG